METFSQVKMQKYKTSKEDTPSTTTLRPYEGSRTMKAGNLLQAPTSALSKHSTVSETQDRLGNVKRALVQASDYKDK